MPSNEAGREVLQHPTTQEAATHFDEQRADYSHLTNQDSTNSLRNEWAHIVAVFDANLPAFVAYVESVRERVRENHGWTGGTDHLRNFIRDGRFVTPEGTTFKVNHNHGAVWCREVCKRWPDVAPHILPTLRRSKFDTFYRGSIFSDDYICALVEANAHPELLEEV